MKFILLVLILIVNLTACAKKEDTGGVVSTPRTNSADKATNRYLAYQHAITVDTEEQKISAVFESVQSKCRSATDEFCEILESRLSTGQTASAFLKFRAKPSGIQKLIAAISKHAEVSEQSSSAEDLASPISDTTKKLEMLKDYRLKLEALRDRAKNDVDALIKLNKELAQVQSELEAINGKHIHLMQRVETEVLMVTIRSVQNQSFWRPIAIAITDFGGNLSQGISVAITGVAYLIPWTLLLMFMAWAGRKFWRRWRAR